MGHQRHDLGRQKRLFADEQARKSAPRARPRRKGSSRPPARFANWCRTHGHPPSCSCLYPDPKELAERDRGLARRRQRERGPQVSS